MNPTSTTETPQETTPSVQKVAEKKGRKVSKPEVLEKPNPLRARPGCSGEIFFKKATSVALYYGFTPLPNLPIKNPERRLRLERALTEDQRGLKFKRDSFLFGRDLLTKLFIDEDWEKLQQPVTLFWGNIPSLISGKKAGHFNEEYSSFSLEVFGANKSIGEAMVISTANAILEELQFKNLMIEINSLGERDSFARFERELGVFYKKHAASLSTHCKGLLRKSALSVLLCQKKECQNLKDTAPKPLGFLSEGSREHLREVIEYFETSGVSYRINQDLLPDGSEFIKSVFEIYSSKESEDGLKVARGCRYDGLSKKLGAKREIPAVGITIECETIGGRAKEVRIPEKSKKPQIYFIQFGFDAKRRSLEILEALREAKIPVYQSLSKDKLTTQLSQAEKLKIPITIIMGQKEAVEGTVIVRSMVNRSQETIAASSLSSYLKKAKLV